VLCLTLSNLKQTRRVARKVFDYVQGPGNIRLRLTVEQKHDGHDGAASGAAVAVEQERIQRRQGDI
jgi:hypothetical protein